MKSIGNPKTFRRLHSDACASSRLESLNIFPSLQEAARSHLLFDWVASSLYLGGLEDPAHCSIMESSGADAASLQVNPFHCQNFLNDLRFDQLYAFVSLFSLKSNFLSNDVGCETFWQDDCRRRLAEQKRLCRQRKREKRLLELERKRERNKTIISYRDHYSWY